MRRIRALRGRTPQPVTARYARILDGETLWLALADGPPAVTLRYLGGELSIPTEQEPAGLVSARVPLAPLAEVPGEGLEVAVLAGEGRHTAPVRWAPAPPPGPVRAVIPTRDRRWRWQVVAPGSRLGLLRGTTAPGVVVSRIETVGDGVRLVLGDGRTVTLTHAAGEPSVDGLPLVRAHDDLRRPSFAVALPQLADGARLRWTPDARLTVVGAEAAATRTTG